MVARRYSVAALLGLAMFATTTQAGWLDDWLRSIPQDFASRNAWPEPIVQSDRQVTQTPYEAMTARGWERQNMLVDYHFEDGSLHLTEAGRLKVRWILTEAPPQHRVIYIHRGEDVQQTTLRVATVQALVPQIAPEAAGVPILVTTLSSEGNPADRVQFVNTEFAKSQPKPQLLSSSGGGSGGSSSGGGQQQK
jgi:hypothetical protein